MSQLPERHGGISLTVLRIRCSLLDSNKSRWKSKVIRYGRTHVMQNEIPQRGPRARALLDHAGDPAVYEGEALARSARVHKIALANDGTVRGGALRATDRLAFLPFSSGDIGKRHA
jgi:hypothetical protein